MMEDRANILRAMKICRFCLSGDIPLTNIYEKTSKDKQLVPLPLQVMACVAIEVFQNDGMPQLICKSCRLQTLQAYNFKTNCKKSDDALKLFLATGQLIKPFMKTCDPDDDDEPAPKKQITEKNVHKTFKSSETIDEPKPKKIKSEPSEVITLNFTQNSDDEVRVREGEHEDECILGLTEGSPEKHTVEDDEFVEGEGRINRMLKVNQVQTDCFPCLHCERSFPLKQLLDLHIVNHEREREYECDECSRKFFTKYDLNKHMQTHAGHKPFSCVVCQKTFSRQSLLHRHEKIHNDVPKYLCSQCDKTFLTRHNLDAHMEKHKKRRPFTCQICNKSFVFKQGLERHELVHSNDKPHKCNYCEASFTSAIKLTRHITSHAGLRPYPCKLCGRTFLLSHHLTRHMRNHYIVQSSAGPDIIGQHKCDICSMSFRRKDSLINHSAIHSMVNLRCVICNTTFENAKMVKEHITTHLSGLPFPCEKCDYSFETQEQLEEHELKHAEMEYEEQIEKEVVEEARQAAEHDEDEEGSDFDEISEFTITNDINNPEIVPSTKRQSKQKKNYAQFLKDELGSDLEDQEHQSEKADQEDEESKDHEEIDSIKPIVRTEGTKVYTRKSTVERKFNPPINPEDIKVAPIDQITQNPTLTTFENLGLSPQAISAMPNKKFVNMKLGDKTVKVQKFIVTKEEMKAMAKQGILEMKGGTVVLKNPGHPIVNATIKPAERVDIETMIGESAKSNRNTIKKTYQRKVLQHTEEEHEEYTMMNPQDEDVNEELIDDSNVPIEQVVNLE